MVEAPIVRDLIAKLAEEFIADRDRMAGIRALEQERVHGGAQSSRRERRRG